jgi:hypothetical protein
VSRGETIDSDSDPDPDPDLDETIKRKLHEKQGHLGVQSAMLFVAGFVS